MLGRKLSLHLGSGWSVTWGGGEREEGGLLSVRQLICPCRLRSHLGLVHMCGCSHAQEVKLRKLRSGMQLPVKANACAMVHPGLRVFSDL